MRGWGPLTRMWLTWQRSMLSHTLTRWGPCMHRYLCWGCLVPYGHCALTVLVLAVAGAE